MHKIKKLIQKLFPHRFYEIIEPQIHLTEAVMTTIRNGFPARGVRFIGVTGTNGKTTTSLMIQKMLHTAGIPTGVLSTVAYGFGADIEQQKLHVTTGRASFLQAKIQEFKAKGAKWIVIETSSHGLAQHRVWGIPFEIGVFTNLTQDHLDYHKTFEAYRTAKRRLFKIVARHGARLGIVYAEDPSAQVFIDTVPRSVTYGTKKGDIRASGVKQTANYLTYTATVGKDIYSIRVNIPGEFNVLNSMAAIAVGREFGLTKEQIEQGIAALETVEGRMNRIEKGQNFGVIVDFASSPDAFEKVFQSVRPVVKGKLIAVFGSAGRRDEEKRAIQGKIAATYADEIILTEEDDRDEDGNMILEQIEAGAKGVSRIKSSHIHKILNREEAIGYAVTLARSKDDMVLVLGKGHEKTIERNDGEYPWSDIDATGAALESLLARK